MRRVEPHKHTFSFPVASREDMEDGASNELIVTPSVLGSAALCDKEEFASADHGGKVDEIYESAKTINKLTTDVAQATQVSGQAIASANAAQTAAQEAKTTAEEAKAESEEAKATADAAKAAADHVVNEMEEIHIIANIAKEKSTQAAEATTRLGFMAQKDSVTLEDLNIGGARDGDHVLSGTGWVPKQAELSEEDREKIAKVEELEEAVQLLRDCCKAQPAAAVLDVGLQERVEQVETTAGEAKTKAESAQEKTTECFAKVNTLDARVTANTTEINLLKTQTEEAKERAISADAKITALEAVSVDNERAREAVKTIEGKLTASEAKSDAAKVASDQATAHVTQMGNRLDGFEQRVTAADTACQNAQAKAVSAETKAISAEVKVTALEREVATTKQCCAEIAEVKNGVEQAKGIANAAQTAARNANSAITAAGINATNALKKATDAETKATEVNTKVVELEAKVKKCSDDLSSAQADLESKIDHNKDDVTEAKTTAESARKTADASKAIIDALSPRVTAVEGKATTLEGKVSTVEGKVTTVEGKVEELEKRPAGGGNVDFYEANKMGDETEFHKLIEANHAKVQGVAAQVGLTPHVTAGMDNSKRWITVEGYKNKPTAWIKDLKDLAVQVTDATVHTLYHQSRLSYLEDVINVGNLTTLSHNRPFLVPHKTDHKKVILKAGTVLSFDIGEKKSHLVFNTDHEISHGIGGAQRGLQRGSDYYIYALVDWDSPTHEVTFTMQASASIPTGYNRSNSLLIGGFHTLCADVGTLLGHALTKYVAGDILPRSIWCLNHRPKCSPAGMVYHAGRDFWVDIYLANVENNMARSRYDFTISSNSQNTFAHSFRVVGKRLMTNEEFTAAIDGTPVGVKMGSKVNKAGGHTGTNNKRIISNIGVEDGFGVYSTFLGDVCTVYNANAAGGAKHEMRTFAAGGSYAIVGPSISHRNGGLLMTSVINMMAARGVCESRTF